MDDFERVKQQVSLEEYAQAHLNHVRGGLECPICESGTGKNKTPAFKIKGERWKCFSCNNGGDVFDLAGHVHHLQENDRARQLQIVADWAGIALERDPRGRAMALDETIGGGFKAAWNRVEAEQGQRPDYTQGRAKEAARVKEAQARLWAMEKAGEVSPIQYLMYRGFTREEVERFGFGYVQTTREDGNGWKNSAGQWENGGRIVIPWKGCGGYYHLDRAITDNERIERKYLKPGTDEVGEQPTGWGGALEGGECFIVEGLLDAYACEAMGYHAIPLAGTAYEKTLRAIASQGYKGTVILMLDGDEAGKKNQELASGLCEALRLRHIKADFSAITGCKDACEAMAEDRDTAIVALETFRLKAEREADEAAKQAQQKAYEALHVQEPGAIAEAIWNCDGYENPVSTGFVSLDNVTNGGFRSGLVVFGAVSSAGKTTLLVQMADYMAACGRPVLFVTIEQSGREIVSKSLSRMMAQRGYQSVSLWEMGNRAVRRKWPVEKESAFVECLNVYCGSIAPNLYVMSADTQPTVYSVKEAAGAIAHDKGVSPVVFIDYLQLLAPGNDRMTDKQAADYNVSELRRLARDMRTPVIAISSLNRTSYSGVIEMESFKESGGIEYGADLLIGLQPYRMEERIEERKGGKDAREKAAKDLTREYRTQSERKSELVILKNRNGYIPRNALPLTFYAASSLFVEGV